MIPKKVLIVYLKPTLGTLPAVKKALDKRKIDYACVSRDKLRPREVRNKDLVISIGGDGTFLAVARHITDQMVLGVNSNPLRKEGFMMRADKENFSAVFDLIISDEFWILKLTRLEAVIDQKRKLSLALNEFYIGERRPFDMCVYRIRVGHEEELQKSSGVIVATATGSYAWAMAAGGKDLPLDSDRFQFVVREPYSGRIVKTTLCSAVLSSNQHLYIHSLMRDGIVSVDASPDVHTLKKGSEIRIGVSKSPLHFIEPIL